MKRLSQQYIFDETWRHLIRQGKPAVNPDIRQGCADRCAYRAPGGGKCAFGFWISDEAYDPAMEGRDSSYVINSYKEMQRFKRYQHLLSALQVNHDNTDNWVDDEGSRFDMDALKQSFIETAGYYDLKIKVLDEPIPEEAQA